MPVGREGSLREPHRVLIRRRVGRAAAMTAGKRSGPEAERPTAMNDEAKNATTTPHQGVAQLPLLLRWPWPHRARSGVIRP